MAHKASKKLGSLSSRSLQQEDNNVKTEKQEASIYFENAALQPSAAPVIMNPPEAPIPLSDWTNIPSFSAQQSASPNLESITHLTEAPNSLTKPTPMKDLIILGEINLGFSLSLPPDLKTMSLNEQEDALTKIVNENILCPSGVQLVTRALQAGCPPADVSNRRLHQNRDADPQWSPIRRNGDNLGTMLGMGLNSISLLSNMQEENEGWNDSPVDFDQRELFEKQTMIYIAPKTNIEYHSYLIRDSADRSVKSGNKALRGDPRKRQNSLIFQANNDTSPQRLLLEYWSWDLTYKVLKKGDQTEDVLQDQLDYRVLDKSIDRWLEIWPGSHASIPGLEFDTFAPLDELTPFTNDGSQEISDATTSFPQIPQKEVLVLRWIGVALGGLAILFFLVPCCLVRCIKSRRKESIFYETDPVSRPQKIASNDSTDNSSGPASWVALDAPCSPESSTTSATPSLRFSTKSDSILTHPSLHIPFVVSSISINEQEPLGTKAFEIPSGFHEDSTRDMSPPVANNDDNRYLPQNLVVVPPNNESTIEQSSPDLAASDTDILTDEDSTRDMSPPVANNDDNRYLPQNLAVVPPNNESTIEQPPPDLAASDTDILTDEDSTRDMSPPVANNDDNRYLPQNLAVVPPNNESTIEQSSPDLAAFDTDSIMEDASHSEDTLTDSCRTTIFQSHLHASILVGNPETAGPSNPAAIVGSQTAIADASVSCIIQTQEHNATTSVSPCLQSTHSGQRKAVSRKSNTTISAPAPTMAEF